jgi:hypothetical protein
LEQASPVIVQPDELRQMVAPVPGSAQIRVQQFEAPEHGFPSWLHPPGSWTQYPALPSFLLQILLQQSSLP